MNTKKISIAYTSTLHTHYTAHISLTLVSKSCASFSMSLVWFFKWPSSAFLMVSNSSWFCLKIKLITLNHKLICQTSQQVHRIRFLYKMPLDSVYARVPYQPWVSQFHFWFSRAHSTGQEVYQWGSLEGSYFWGHRVHSSGQQYNLHHMLKDKQKITLNNTIHLISIEAKMCLWNFISPWQKSIAVNLTLKPPWLVT